MAESTATSGLLVTVICAAAGRGERLGDSVPKALSKVAGRSLLEHCLTRLLGLPHELRIVITTPGDHLAEFRAIRSSFPSLDITLVVGGATRADSVSRALAECPRDGVILVHDVARAFTPAKVFERVIRSAAAGSATIPVVAVADTIRRREPSGIGSVVDRNELVAVQTPQGFPASMLHEAYEAGHDDTATDDAAVAAAAGNAITCVAGDRLAFKVTEQFDLVVAETVSARYPNE